MNEYEWANLRGILNFAALARIEKINEIESFINFADHTSRGKMGI